MSLLFANKFCEARLSPGPPLVGSFPLGRAEQPPRFRRKVAVTATYVPDSGHSTATVGRRMGSGADGKGCGKATHIQPLASENIPGMQLLPEEFMPGGRTLPR